MRHIYRVSGMHCEECSRKIRGALESIPEVKSALVTLNPPQAIVVMENHVPLSKLEEAVKGVGEYQLSESDSEMHPSQSTTVQPKAETYYPLILIAAYLLGGVFLRELFLWRFDAHAMMANFMGGFFVIFSFFKLLDLKGFAEGYATYDIVAARYPEYGKVYPFLELMLGVLYLFVENTYFTSLLTVLLMAVSSVGVIKSMLSGREFQCACLGTIFKLPLSSVTLVEDLLMLGMAILMIL